MDGKFSIHFREKITLEMTAVQWSLKKIKFTREFIKEIFSKRKNKKKT